MHREGFVYPDHGLICPACGKHVKNNQALTNHQRWCKGPSSSTQASSIGNTPAAEPIQAGNTPPTDPNVKTSRDLAEELKQIQLKQQIKQAKTAVEYPELTQVAGIGSLEGEAKQLVLKRALGLSDEPKPLQPESWLMTILKNPESIRLLADGLKGILGITPPAQHGDGDGFSMALKLLGVNDLGEFVAKYKSPSAPSGMKIGSIDLTGAALTPELLKSIMAYEQAERQITYQKSKDETLANGLQNFGKTLAPLIAPFLADKFGSPRDGGVSRMASRPSPSDAAWNNHDIGAHCSKCGSNFSVPADTPVGTTIQCPSCGVALQVMKDSPPLAVPSSSTPVSIEPEPVSIDCVKCGQKINVTNLGIGAKVTCPICNSEQVLMNPAEPVAPAKVDGAVGATKEGLPKLV